MQVLMSKQTYSYTSAVVGDHVESLFLNSRVNGVVSVIAVHLTDGPFKILVCFTLAIPWFLQTVP